MSASSLLEHIGLCLRNAEIDVKTLRILQENNASFLTLDALLCEVEESTESTEGGEASKLSQVNKTPEHETSSAKLFLAMRSDELEAFEKERDAVQSFIEMCSMVKSGESENHLSVD